MTDRIFVYRNGRGERREAPITIFRVPSGVTLVSEHTYLNDRSSDTLDLKLSDSGVGQAPLPAKQLQQTQ